MKNDPATTLEPIGLIAEASLVLVVGPRMKVSTVAEFIEAAKKTQLSYGSASNASASHLAALLLQRAAGFKALHVPYRGAAPALNDLVGGHVDFHGDDDSLGHRLIEGKQLKGLMVTGASRAEVLPDIQTPAEAGLPNYRAAAWYALLGPKGLPPEVSRKLQTSMSVALANAELRARLKDDGAYPSDLRGQAFAITWPPIASAGATSCARRTCRCASSARQAESSRPSRRTKASHFAISLSSIHSSG